MNEGAIESPHQQSATTRACVWLICCLLVLLIGAVFGQTAGFEFVNYDDALYVYENDAVTGGLTSSGITQVFTRPQLSDWTPISAVSHMIGWQFFGSWAGGHHLINVLCHAMATVLLFLTLKRMTGGLWSSAMVAALFGVHPLHVESVAWVAERKDVLSGLFFMLTLAAYARYARSASIPNYLLVFLALTLGLMSKAILITTPFVLLLLDFWPLGRAEHTKLSRLVMEKVPLILLCCVIAAVGFHVNDPASSITQWFSFELRASNAVAACATYIWQMVWPRNLAVPYPFPFNGVERMQLAAAASTLLGLTLLAVVFRRGSPWLLVGWLWYLGMLAPVCGLIMPGEFARADRYTYLPYIGLSLAVVWTVRTIMVRHSLPRVVPVTMAAATVVISAVLSWQQTRVWQNSETLWHHTLAVTGPNAAAHKNLGYFYDRTGRPEAAVEHYREALRISPYNPDVHYSLGRLLLNAQSLDEAVMHLTMALQVRPDHARARDLLGVAYARQGKIAEAIDQFHRALDADSQMAEAHNNLANALLQAQRIEEGLGHFQKAIEINPRYADAHYNLGTALSGVGRTEDAITQLQKAIELEPGMAKAYNNLAVAEAKCGRIEEAVAHYQAALVRDGSLADASNNLAWLLATSPRDNIRNGAKAVVLARKAEEIVHGGNPIILRTLAAACAEAGHFEEAKSVAARAAALASAQNYGALVSALESDVEGYKAGRPVRDPSLR